uniref:Uncharacterized protein n=1 Tax=Strigamia maritima TaxID=126957 RepID=T1JDL1_STRMM
MATATTTRSSPSDKLFVFYLNPQLQLDSAWENRTISVSDYSITSNTKNQCKICFSYFPIALQRGSSEAMAALWYVEFFISAFVEADCLVLFNWKRRFCCILGMPIAKVVVMEIIMNKEIILKAQTSRRLHRHLINTGIVTMAAALSVSQLDGVNQMFRKELQSVYPWLSEFKSSVFVNTRERQSEIYIFLEVSVLYLFFSLYFEFLTDTISKSSALFTKFLLLVFINSPPSLTSPRFQLTSSSQGDARTIIF